METATPIDDLALERAAARLYARRFADVDQGLAAWERLLPSRRQAMREEVRFARLWFRAIAGTEVPDAVDPRIPALLCPHAAPRGRRPEVGMAISTQVPVAGAPEGVRDQSI